MPIAGEKGVLFIWQSPPIWWGEERGGGMVNIRAAKENTGTDKISDETQGFVF